MQELSSYQKRKLLENPNVEKITEKFVSFTPDFKSLAVKKYLNGENANEIFLQAKIPIHFFKSDYCRSCLKRWKKKFQQDGASSFSDEKRGSSKVGRPKKENLDDLSYEELQAIIEIQKGVITELKKKKALAKKRH